MISLTNFHKYLYRLFAIMKDTGLEVDISYHHGKVYRVYVLPTNRRLTSKYKYRAPSQAKKPLVVVKRLCPVCNNLIIAGVCLTKDCATNKKKPR